MADNVEVLSEETLRNMGVFSEDALRDARTNSDGFVGERDGTKYFRNRDYVDFRTPARNVQLPGQMGDADGPRPMRRDN